MNDLLFRALAEASPNAVWIADPNGTIVFLNEKWEEWTGLSLEATRAQGWPLAPHPDEQSEVQNAFAGALAKRQPFQLQYRIKCPSGRYRWITNYGAPCFGHDGELLGYTGTCVDITIEVEHAEQRLQEAALREHQAKLAAAAKLSSLGEMASGICHEINNPLAIISAKASQVRDWVTAGSPDPDRVIEGLLKIEETSTRIARIVQGLRSFARSAESDPFMSASLWQIIDNTLRFCRERFRYHNIDLRVQPFKDVQLNCRESQISQMLLNLLNNAYDAVVGSPDAWVEISVELSPRRAQIHITDSGPGIDLLVASRMMEPFYTTKQVGKGTGLGLSISQGIAQDHDGKLKYDPSCPHTRFTIVLPLQKRTERSQSTLAFADKGLDSSY